MIEYVHKYVSISMLCFPGCANEVLVCETTYTDKSRQNA